MKSHRLHRHRQAKVDSSVYVGDNGSRPQQLATVAATSAAVQPDNVPSAATVSVLNTCPATMAGLKQALQATPSDAFDCQTPHHTKLPAPGANIACELHAHQQPQTGHADSIASGQHASTDPIMSTISHRRPKWRDEVAHRQKGASKTYATLSLQRASSAATLEEPNNPVRPDMQAKSVRLVPQENHQPNVGQLQLPKAITAHTRQKRVMHSSTAEAAQHVSAGQSSGKQASHPAVLARQAHASSSPSRSIVPVGIQTKVSQHQALNPESKPSSLTTLPSNAAPPHRLQTAVSGPVQAMHKKLAQHEQLTGKAQICLQEGSETQPDPQVDCANGAVLLPQDSNMLSPNSAYLGEADRDLMNSAVCSRLASSPAQLSCTPCLQPEASDSQNCPSASTDTADCCLDMPGPILAVVAVYRQALMWTPPLRSIIHVQAAFTPSSSRTVHGNLSTARTMAKAWQIYLDVHPVVSTELQFRSALICLSVTTGM